MGGKKEKETAAHTCYVFYRLSRPDGFKEGRCGCYLIYSVCCRCRINLTATGNVDTPAETEIACRMNGYSLVYSRARFVQWTECVVFLNEGTGWVK